MKHYTFYFAVGLLAFLSSSFLVKIDYNFSNTQFLTEKIEIANLENSQNQAKKLIPQNETKIKSFEEIKFVCEDEKLNYFFQEFLKEKWLFENLKGQQKIFDCAEELEVQEVDLNSDKKPEYIVEFMCLDAHGNGLQSIFELKNKKYKRISSFVYRMNFRIKKAKTNKYKDLVLFCNYSNGNGEFNNYRFNGREYIAHNCSYSYPDHTLEKIKCRKFGE